MWLYPLFPQIHFLTSCFNSFHIPLPSIHIPIQLPTKSSTVNIYKGFSRNSWGPAVWICREEPIKKPNNHWKAFLLGVGSGNKLQRDIRTLVSIGLMLTCSWATSEDWGRAAESFHVKQPWSGWSILLKAGSLPTQVHWRTNLSSKYLVRIQHLNCFNIFYFIIYFIFIKFWMVILVNRTI